MADLSKLTLKEIDILYGSKENLEEVYEDFLKQFPENERKSKEHLIGLMAGNQYKLVVVNKKEPKELLAYALIYVPKGQDVIWLDYIAVVKPYQSAGLGSLLFNFILKNGKMNKGILIEVEKPVVEDILTTKRVSFYHRLGAKCLSINYQLPTREGAYPMKLYYKPMAQQYLSKEELEKVITSAFEYIHVDITTRLVTLKEVKRSINKDYNL